MKYFGVSHSFMKKILMKVGKYRIAEEEVANLAYDCKRHEEILKKYEESGDLHDTLYTKVKEFYSNRTPLYVKIRRFNQKKTPMHLSGKVNKFIDLYEKIKGGDDKKVPITVTSNGIRLDGSHRASILKALGVKKTSVKVIYAPRFLVWLIGREIAKRREFYDKFRGKKAYVNREFKGKVLYTDCIRKSFLGINDNYHILDTGVIIGAKECYLEE